MAVRGSSGVAIPGFADVGNRPRHDVFDRLDVSLPFEVSVIADDRELTVDGSEHRAPADVAHTICNAIGGDVNALRATAFVS